MGDSAALAAQAAVAYQTEREEAFREACALGNVRAVQQMLRSGTIAINGQNRVNGWTALHWAAYRGHEAIVALLLAHGADPTLKTKDGRQPVHLAKTEQIRQQLAGQIKDTTPATSDASTSASASASSSSLPFTPHYLEQPDLSRVWATPDEMEPPVPRSILSSEAGRKTTDQDSANPEQMCEFVVYQDTPSDEHILGAVRISPQATIDMLWEQCRHELDLDKSSATLARVVQVAGTRRCVPISQSQRSKQIQQVFGQCLPDQPLELVIRSTV